MTSYSTNVKKMVPGLIVFAGLMVVAVIISSVTNPQA